MSDAVREVRRSDGAARADRPLPDTDRLSGGPDARRLLGTRIEYIDHPSFDDPDARDAILAAMPGSAAAQATRRARRPEIDGLDDVPLLSHAQEAHLFRQMNYLKSLAETARARLDPDRPRRRDLEEFERLRGAAVAVKQQIVRANLRLVVSIARRYVGRGGDLAELIGIGNLALVRAVDKFDFARGHKFSTYATWAIRNDLFATNRRDGHPRERLVPEHAAIYRDTADTRVDPSEQQRAQDQRERVVARLLGRLDERERRILVGRFGIGGAREETLSQISVELGITKERVRQIEWSARGKLRQYADEVEFLLPSA
jgi:RNA polymerase primary sigma factor